MKVLFRCLMLLAFLFSPMLLGCNSQLSEEETLQEIAAEEEEEAQEEDVLAESEEGDESEDEEECSRSASCAFLERARVDVD